MNPDYEKKLEAQVDAELKTLGDLTAPATLAPRVLRALEKRSLRPWYRQSWSTWPRGLQFASFASLALLFAGVFAAAWMITHGVAGQGIGSLFGEWFRSAGVAFKVVEVVKESLVLALRHLGTGVIAGCIAMMALLWAACVGLGTLYVRLGMQPAVNGR